MKKISLLVDGWPVDFTEEELTIIVERYLKIEAKETAPKPTEGKWFNVKPESINRKLFEDKREDSSEEKVRQIILEAFLELEKNPDKYAKSFQTMIPKKVWRERTVAEFKNIAAEIGDQMADWVHQALEWAQRINNGESWETICKKQDTSNWFRLVIWKNGYARIVGGRLAGYGIHSVSDINEYDMGPTENLKTTVPLVMRY